MSESLAHASVHVHACEWYVCLAYLLASSARSLSFQSVGLPLIAFLTGTDPTHGMSAWGMSPCIYRATMRHDSVTQRLFSPLRLTNMCNYSIITEILRNVVLGVNGETFQAVIDWFSRALIQHCIYAIFLAWPTGSKKSQYIFLQTHPSWFVWGSGHGS